VTDYPPQDEPQDLLSPFAPPEVIGAREEIEEELIDREPLSLGGRIAWIVIAVVVISMITVTAVFRAGEESRTEATASDLFPIQLQARSVVGQRNFFGKKADDEEDPAAVASDSADGDSADEDSDEDATSSKSMSPVPEELNDGTYEQRLCYVLLCGEIYGPDNAAQKLSELSWAR